MTNLRAGLCSITYRQLRPAEIVELAVAAGIEGIEWGGDIHVPAGDVGAADDVAARCADARVAIPSYGSYLGIGASTTKEFLAEARTTLWTAQALGAPLVRMWTQLGVGPQASPSERLNVMRRVEQAARLTDEYDVDLALEFHPDTLTETAASARQLIEQVGHPRLRTHWQPDHRLGPDATIAEFDIVAPWLAHLHVYAWGAGGYDDRLPLESGAPIWQPILTRAAALPMRDGGGRFALLEHIEADAPTHLRRDAATLRAWIHQLPEPAERDHR